jgi:mRNA interferase HicA
VKAAVFIRRARRYARIHGLEFEYDARHGKGSHGRVYLGNRLTTVKGGGSTIGRGLLQKMLKDLGIDPEKF